MSWERPKTIKLYLSPPEADRLITVWPDFKVISKKNQPDKEVPNNDSFKKVPNDDSFGIHFILGVSAKALDWQKTKFIVREDGIPVQTLISNFNDFSLKLESFCNFDAFPHTFIKLTVKNNSGIKNKFVFGIMPRLASSSLLYGLGGDFYSSYNPMLEHWDMAANSWELKDNFLEDGNKAISFNTPQEAAYKWVERNKNNIIAKNYLEFSAGFEKNESKEFYFLMSHKGYVEINKYEYDGNFNETVSKWREELDKIIIRPKTSDKKIQTMFNSLVCQCLQMFAVANDGLVRPRQGGKYHGAYSVEAFEFLSALDRIGLSSWAKKGYDFFSNYQIKKGDDRGKFFAGIGMVQWMSYTAGVLYGLAYHLQKQGSKEYFKKWKPVAMEGINWVERQRNKMKKNRKELGYGLLPSGIVHDWGTNGQYWSFTDGITYMALKEMAKAFKKFNDPLAVKLKKITKDYENSLKNTLKKVLAPQKNRREIFIPNVLGVKEAYPPQGPYFCDGPAILIRAGIIDSKSDVFKKIEKYFINRGWMKNGLTGLMTDCLLQQSFQGDKWAGHTWYVNFPDMVWFYAWLKRGEKKKAKKTLDAQLKYAMSPEYYMVERYADNDPAFCPWQPNASANGRTIMMLLDFYGQKRRG